MKTRTILLLLIYFTYTGYVAAQFDSLTIELEDLWKKSNIPGFAVSLVTPEGGTLYAKGFGYADRKLETPFITSTIINLGPVSQLVVGVAIIKAVEDGSLTMDSEINEFLPFPIFNPYHKNIPILIRHLASHSSTLLDTRNYGKTYIPMFEGLEETESDTSEFYRYIHEHASSSPLEFVENLVSVKGKWYKQRNFLSVKPGASMDFTNINATIAALVLQEATHYPFKAYCEQRIFDTLEMNNTTWSVDEIDMSSYATLYFSDGQIVPRYKLITYPDGGLFSNVDDMSRFLKEIMVVSKGTSHFLNDKYGELLLPGDDDQDFTFWGMDSYQNIGLSGGAPGIHAEVNFDKRKMIGQVILCNVNTEENEELLLEYQKLQMILNKYRRKISEASLH